MSKMIIEMGMKLSSYSMNIVFENSVISRRIIAIVNPDSAPIKRMMKAAKENNMLIDGTSGKPTRSTIIMDSRYVILSSISPRNLSTRLDKENLA
jgi:regulator of extracellular matrix RemA (YlzA/DUF370 family)